jgi:hypothetical protein
MIVKEYGTPAGSAFANNALVSDVPTDDLATMPTLEECKDDFDANEVSVLFTFVAFSSSIAPGRDLYHVCVVDSACSMNFTAFRHDFVTFDQSETPSRVGGVCVDAKGSGTIRLTILLASCEIIHRTVHALYTMTSPLALPNVLVACSVLAGCSRLAVVKSFFPPTLTVE